MKIKTSELIGPALDWAVCNAAGMFEVYPKIGVGKTFLRLHTGNSAKYIHPSTEWAQGGPIVEREKITLAYLKVEGVIRWEARYFDDAGRFRSCDYGPTPLIAAMRCYVAYKIGGEVDVPEELLT